MDRRSFLSTSLAAAAAAPVVTAGLAGSAQAAQGAAADPGADPVVSNPNIAADRRAGLDRLKPSKRDLEHGLELHANSVVLDTYGFGPNAGIDQSVIAKVINSGASEWEVNDAREDMMMTRMVTDAAERAEYEGAWKAAGVTAIVRNAGEESSDTIRLMKRLARWVYVTDHLRHRFPKAIKADDIVAAKKAGHHAITLTTNGVPLVQQWLNTLDELRHIRVFAEFGVRMMHLTYNRRNAIGDGCGEAIDAGLSDFGRMVVGELNKQGVIADCAHSSLKTGYDAAKITKKPMVASHSSVASLNQHIRAKSDEVIKAIVDTGGILGVCCIGHFLGGSRDIVALLDHIDYMIKRFGEDSVGIGTDVGYTSRVKTPAPDVKIPARAPQRVRWESIWPPGSLGAERDPVAAASLAWTNWPLFTVGMVQRGHSDATIQKVLAGNMLRVLRANEA
jgi:membrane dipeptidase